LRRNEHQKFLSLWKDADPSIDGVEDARKRLGGVERSALESLPPYYKQRYS